MGIKDQTFGFNGYFHVPLMVVSPLAHNQSAAVNPLPWYTLHSVIDHQLTRNPFKRASWPAGLAATPYKNVVRATVHKMIRNLSTKPLRRISITLITCFSLLSLTLQQCSRNVRPTRRSWSTRSERRPPAVHRRIYCWPAIGSRWWWKWKVPSSSITIHHIIINHRSSSSSRILGIIIRTLRWLVVNSNSSTIRRIRLFGSAPEGRRPSKVIPIGCGWR